VGFDTAEVVEIILNFPAFSSFFSTPATALALASAFMTLSDSLSRRTNTIQWPKCQTEIQMPSVGRQSVSICATFFISISNVGTKCV
jgi:hypothetical protein